MNWKNRLIRLTVALALTAAIASQIPGRVGIAQAQYGGGGGGGARTLIQATVFGLVAYGIYSTVTGGGVPAPLPPTEVPTVDPTVADPEAPVAGPGDPIWDVTNKTADLNQFAKASDSAGLKDTLRSDQQFTAFVPTNNAFAALDPQVLQDLMQEENKAKLADIVGYHVVKGAYTIEQLKAQVAQAGTEGLKLTTLTNKTVTITNEGGLKINGTPIVETDIPATNGVIHPIGSVLLPSEEVEE
ncbi:MAG: hypothetical protein OHK0029_38130 [Armatimonadaceae bacterium]